MINKISSSVRPISPDVDSDSGGHSPGSDPSSQEKKKENPKPELRVVEAPTETPSVDPEEFFKNVAVPEASPPPVETRCADPRATKTGAFVQTLTALKRHKEAVFRWLGIATYSAARARGKNAAIKKGIIVDSQIE